MKNTIVKPFKKSLYFVLVFEFVILILFNVFNQHFDLKINIIISLGIATILTIILVFNKIKYRWIIFDELGIYVCSKKNLVFYKEISKFEYMVPTFKKCVQSLFLNKNEIENKFPGIFKIYYKDDITEFFISEKRLKRIILLYKINVRYVGQYSNYKSECIQLNINKKNKNS